MVPKIEKIKRLLFGLIEKDLYLCRVYMIERDGKVPMPLEVFKERKKVINELSKDLKN